PRRWPGVAILPRSPRMDPLSLALGIMAPAFAAGIILAIAWWRRDAAPDRSRATSAVAMAAAFALAQLLVVGMPARPITEATTWIALGALVAAGVGVFESLR